MSLFLNIGKSNCSRNCLPKGATHFFTIRFCTCSCSRWLFTTVGCIIIFTTNNCERNNICRKYLIFFQIHRHNTFWWVQLMQCERCDIHKSLPPGVREVMGLISIRDLALFLCHSCGVLIISHLSHYHFPLMTAVSFCLSKQMKLISLTFFKTMRKINAP